MSPSASRKRTSRKYNSGGASGGAQQLAIFFGATIAYAIVVGLLISGLDAGSPGILVAIVVYLFLMFILLTLYGNYTSRKSIGIAIERVEKGDRSGPPPDNNNGWTINQGNRGGDGGIEQQAIRCTSGDYGDDTWDAGFKADDGATPYASFLDREKYLQSVARDTVKHVESAEVLQTLDLDGSDDKLEQQQLPCCPVTTDWQGTFKGMPTTFIDAPPRKTSKKRAGCNSGAEEEEAEGGGVDNGCLLAPDGWQKKDKRLWFRSLDDEMYSRSRRNAEIWDPYKHHYARQMYAQFISSNMVNRKSFYERPIEHLEEASCFQKKINNDNDIPSIN